VLTGAAGMGSVEVTSGKLVRSDVMGMRTAKEPVPVLVTRVGLQIPQDLTYEGWERAGRRLTDVMDSSAWCLGDWVVHGEKHYADRYRRAVDAVGLEYQTIRNYAWVARRFERSRRRTALSFQHHAEVARLGDEEQELWLGRAEELKWSRNELRRNIKAVRSGVGSPPEKVSLPRIEADHNRVERWRAAAECTDDNLGQWIIASLDAAAAAVLGDALLRRP
jgi:hypothetical protein